MNKITSFSNNNFSLLTFRNKFKTKIAIEKRPKCLLYWSILLKRHLPLKLQLKFIWKELLISSEANVAVSFLTSKNVEFMILIYFYWIDFMSFVFYTLPRFFGPQLHVMILKPNSMRAKYHFFYLFIWPI